MALPEGALAVILKEYDTLRDEVKERLKIAFSHVAYVGAIVAFSVPAADKIGNWLVPAKPLWGMAEIGLLAVICVIPLVWVAVLNMRWVQHCGVHMQSIENRVNEHFGCKILGWERYSESVKAKMFLYLPKKPEQCSDSVESNTPNK